MSKNKLGCVDDNMTEEQYKVHAYCEVLDSLNHDIVNKKLGKVLTIIDASIQDVEQRKAIKDLIHQEFTILRNEIQEISGLNFNRLSEVLDTGLSCVNIEIGSDGHPTSTINYYFNGKFLPPVLGSNDKLEPIIKK